VDDERTPTVEEEAEPAAPPPAIDAAVGQAGATADPAAGPVAPGGAVPRSRAMVALWVVLGTLLVTTALAVTVGSLAHAPYIVYAPGSAIRTEPLIEVDDADTFETDGSILFLTVSLRGASRRVGYAEALWGWISPHQDVFPRRAILGDQTGIENREEAAVEMNRSQEVAAAVALGHLGFEDTITGTGVTIQDTVVGSPAAEVLEAGDTILAVDGVPTLLTDDLRAAIEPRLPGELVEVDVERDGAERTVKVELTSDVEDPNRTLLGVTNVTTRDLRIDLPFDVVIATQDVGGPSAGLALALGVLDRLTPGSLTGGHDVAVTGTIELDGRVGRVGGIQQKTVAAIDAGATLILVPALEVAEAELKAGDDIEVVGVETLDDALAALAAVGGNALDLERPGG